MAIDIINPLNYAGWNELLETNPHSSFFHTANWAQVLAESYGFTPLYFCRIEHERMVSLLPMMEVDSWLTGRRGVSLPFTDAVPVIAGTTEAVDELFELSAAHGRQRQWKYFEFRPGSDLFTGEKQHAVFVNHQLPLDNTEEQLFKQFRESTRRNIKIAYKNRIEVIFSASFRAVKEFYRLNCSARKDHGLPPQPFRFFANLQKHALKKGLGMIANGISKGKVISSNIYLFHKNRAFYKFGANDRKHMNLRSSYLAMWEAIRYFLSKGFDLLDFGRTDADDAGLLQFKRGWGTDEIPVNYYRYDLRREAFVGSAGGMKTSYSICKYMPLPALRLVGWGLYRHFG